MSVFLILLMLLVSTGMTLSAHFCGGELKKMAVFQSGELSCDMKTKPVCPAHPDENKKSEQNACCEDVELSADSFALEAPTATVEQQQLSPAMINFSAAYLVALLYPVGQSDNVTYSDYTPPIAIQDIPVLVQSFLL